MLKVLPQAKMTEKKPATSGFFTTKIRFSSSLYLTHQTSQWHNQFNKFLIESLSISPEGLIEEEKLPLKSREIGYIFG